MITSCHQCIKGSKGYDQVVAVLWLDVATPPSPQFHLSSSLWVHLRFSPTLPSLAYQTDCGVCMLFFTYGLQFLWCGRDIKQKSFTHPRFSPSLCPFLWGKRIYSYSAPPPPPLPLLSSLITIIAIVYFSLHIHLWTLSSSWFFWVHVWVLMQHLWCQVVSTWAFP